MSQADLQPETRNHLAARIRHIGGGAFTAAMAAHEPGAAAGPVDTGADTLAGVGGLAAAGFAAAGFAAAGFAAAGFAAAGFAAAGSDRTTW